MAENVMTAESAAALFNGLKYPAREIGRNNNALKDAGLVAVYGQSDDLMEFAGAINDEVGAWDGAIAYVDSEGLFPSWHDICDDEESAAYFRRKPNTRAIKAIWSPDEIAASWLIKTDIPHVTFDIMEDGELYCRGLVFAMSALSRTQDNTDGR